MKSNIPIVRVVQTLAGVVLLAVSLSTAREALTGQNEIEQSIRNTYVGKTLSLRNFYISPSQEFDSSGVLIGERSVGPWTLYGRVLVDDIRLEPHSLEVRAHRLSLRWLLQDREFQAVRSDEVRLKIDLAREPSCAQDVNLLLASVFVEPGEDFSALVPAYWKQFCSHMNDPDWSRKETAKVRAQMTNQYHGAPYTIKQPASKAKINAKEVLAVVINEDGHISEVEVIRPVGMGLDEKAVETVEMWKFKRAQPYGRPTPIRTLVEIGFHVN